MSLSNKSIRHRRRANPPTSRRSKFPDPLSPAELRSHQQRHLEMLAHRYYPAVRLLFWDADEALPEGRSFDFFAFPGRQVPERIVLA